MDLIIRKCMKCGALIEVLNDCKCENCGIKCCGETMRTFVPNAEDASFEKHLPVVEVVGDKKSSNLIYSISSSLRLLVVVLVGISLMYFFTIFILLCSASNFI